MTWECETYDMGLRLISASVTPVNKYIRQQFKKLRQFFLLRMYDFDGWSLIYPYANLSYCNNLRNILRRDDNHLLQPTSLKNKKYDPERMKNTQVKAIDVEAVLGCNGETVPIVVSLVNYYGYTLVDTYVHPFTPVRDWVSDVTGFDAYDWHNLVNDGDVPILTYKQVMQKIEEYLEDDDILIGHNVKSDIEFLGLDTDGLEIIDTQASMSGNDGLPYQPGLARVMRRYFNITIQDGSHDSLEDARASLLIYRSLIE